MAYTCSKVQPIVARLEIKVATADPNDISSLPKADQEAIGATLLALLSGFQERDADKLVGVYTSDADWVNAFGSVKKGGDEIVEYLRGLFSDDNFNAGTLKALNRTGKFGGSNPRREDRANAYQQAVPTRAERAGGRHGVRMASGAESH